MPELIYPTMDHREMWMDILNEWTDTEEDVTPYALFYRQDDFDVFLKNRMPALWAFFLIVWDIVFLVKDCCFLFLKN